MNSTKISMVILGSMSMVGHVHAQGSLTPPGAPAVSMKTLEQVEPRIDLATIGSVYPGLEVYITNSGSYYLSGNLVSTNAAGLAIGVGAPNVTLDLNGFNVSDESGSGLYGIYISTELAHVTVFNGTISGFEYGIRCDPDFGVAGIAKGCHFEKLAISGSSVCGLWTGVSSRIIDCRVSDNSGSGIIAAPGSTISGCTANNNAGDYGIAADWGSSLTGCSAYNNVSKRSIYVGSGSTVSGCAAYGNNAQYGIYLQAGSTLTDSTASGNIGSGSASYGIYAEQGCTIIGCTAYRNSNTNSPVVSHQGVGIYAGIGATIKSCTVSENRGDGIRVDSKCRVVGNTCHHSGFDTISAFKFDAAGIHALNGGNHIDGNTITYTLRGIEADNAENLIIRNSASGNTTNYVIAAGNDVGTIQTSPVGAGAWDNFSY